jgi:nicotinamidase-related amidase
MNADGALYQRSSELISRNSSRLLIVDLQEKLFPSIAHAGRVLDNCVKLATAGAAMGVPCHATEQYPKGLGPTMARLARLLPQPLQKLRFSCCEVLAWGPAADQPDGRHQVVVAGIEAHVCILQTVLDLLALGFQVFVPADAVSSRAEFDWRMALERMTNCGATITTTESVLFEWCEVAGTPEFKELIQLIK